MSVITDDIEVIGKKSRAIPKEETNLYELYKNFGPNSDGKGIKIAILDTGCGKFYFFVHVVMYVDVPKLISNMTIYS